MEIYQGDVVQSSELTLTRGYLSAQSPVLHFGLGTAAVDKVVVQWPDGRRNVLKKEVINTTLHFAWKDARVEGGSTKQETAFALLAEFAVHVEDDFDDFLQQPLLPHRYSRLGPIPAIVDDNIYLPGPQGRSGVLKQLKDLNPPKGDQSKQGAETAEGEITANSLSTLLLKEKYRNKEEISALFFDADSDGDQDLYIVNGGNDVTKPGEFYQDVLYRNEGKYFEEIPLPEMPTSGQVITPADFDADGDLDLFVGGRVVPGFYSHPANSYLLKNDGSGYFTNVTDSLAPELSKVGMVTAAVWADFNGDGRLDLAITGEWMSVQIWLNTPMGFIPTEPAAAPIGWWYALEAADLDHDGDLDLLAGNLGKNYKYQTGADNFFEVFTNDFDENGRSDIVLANAKKSGDHLPIRGRECSSEQIPAIAQRFPTYAAFAKADLSEIYGERMLKQSIHYVAEEFGHHWLENRGDGTFIQHLLPNITQVSRIKTITPFDYNGDPYPDFILAGNLLYAEVETPRSDGGYAVILLGGSNGPSEVVGPAESGLFLTGEIRDIQYLPNIDALLVARNDASILIYQRQNTNTKSVLGFLLPDNQAVTNLSSLKITHL
ncbi:MAG: FG-GAP-like repeat-containing protein, partial [Bacteroidota bacterium]